MHNTIAALIALNLQIPLPGIHEQSRDWLDLFFPPQPAANAQEAIPADDLETRLRRIESNQQNLIDEIRSIRNQEKSASLTYVSLDQTGHRILRTDHGNLLIRIQKSEAVTSGGIRVTFEIGNPTGLEIQEFKLKGDYGSRFPDHDEGESPRAYWERFRNWEEDLTSFEHEISKPLKPDVWTPLSFVLKSAKENDLKLIRIAVEVGRARLVDASKDVYSTVFVERTGAAMIKTDYGPLLMTITGTENLGKETRILAMIGNPYGFAINKCGISGQFGPLPPEKVESENHSLYEKRLQIWKELMQEFETTLANPIAPMGWSETSFSIPETDPELLEYIRMRTKISNITMPTNVDAP